VRFSNRSEAGQILGGLLQTYKDRDDVVVLALPRGGVPVGEAVARELRAPFDIFIVRKLGVPGQEELAMGAIASGGVRVLNDLVIRQLRIEPETIESIVVYETEEVRRREQLYRGNRAFPDIAGKTVIVVDDGLATGSTMRAAVNALRPLQAAKIVVAVPTAASETCAELSAEADSVVCASTPEPFHAVGLWYDDFRQTTDEEVQAILQRTERVA
jgi:predicted phosphoribosyltransferase